MLTPEELEPFQPSKIGLSSWNTPLRQGIALLIELLSGRMGVIVAPTHTHSGFDPNKTLLRSSWVYRFSHITFPPLPDPVNHANLHAALCGICVLHRFNNEQAPQALHLARHLSIAIRRVCGKDWSFAHTTDPTETLTFTYRPR